ncbi:MAG: winged helix-turn-helix transcriptional regulator [Devosia nanyangense]|uniref:Winged helix-turn-helix transcriptional regulator n=1 Tax=Devosia nanyangense TaxID=1228055 RepID=A0A933L6F4_9HYPH|nr:winged helix-turn-helix transcriptional regulator [Devosia nanyangense]
MNKKTQPIRPGPPATAMSPLTAFLIEMSGHMMISLAQNLRHQSMSLAEFATLALLMPGKPLRINDVAEALDHPLPAASRIVSSLVDRGLVERREDPDDRRAKALTLTAPGHALMNGLAVSLVDRVEASLAGMSGSATEALRPVFASLRQADGARPGGEPVAAANNLEHGSSEPATNAPRAPRSSRK